LNPLASAFPAACRRVSKQKQNGFFPLRIEDFPQLAAESFNAFASGFAQVFTGATFLLMLIGIAVGFVVGILPGLGGPATIALMLPFIVKMPPIQAFALLLGMAFSFSIVAVMACALWESRKFAFTSGLFPWLIGYPVLLLAITQFIQDSREGSGMDARRKLSSAVSESGVTRRDFNLRTAKTIFWIIGFLLPVWLLGFKIGAPLCTIAHLKWGEKESWTLALVFACVTWAFIYFILELLLTRMKAPLTRPTFPAGSCRWPSTIAAGSTGPRSD
jgi:hypothetical protein